MVKRQHQHHARYAKPQSRKSERQAAVYRRRRVDEPIPLQPQPPAQMSQFVFYHADTSLYHHRVVLHELVDEVNLPFARDLGCARRAVYAVAVHVTAFLDLEQTHFHRALCRDVLVVACLDEVALVAHPLEQAFLPDVDTVLLDELRQPANKD